MLAVRLVKKEPEQVEAGEERGGKVDVLLGRAVRVILGEDRVGGREHRGASVERGSDPGLGNRDGLLLHHLVDGGPVALFHLVELVDAADPHVGEHESPALKHELACRRVARHSSSETDSR